MQLKWLLVSVLTVPLVVPAVAVEASSAPGAADASGPTAPVAEGATDSDATSEVIITATKRASTVQ
jgi:ABC-type transport system involved in cytochrome c biogenesis permease component